MSMYNQPRFVLSSHAGAIYERNAHGFLRDELYDLMTRKPPVPAERSAQKVCDADDPSNSMFY